MKLFNKVRGSMPTVPNIEVNSDTVYIRSNIVPNNADDFKGWQYDEVQYSVKEYVETLSNTQDTQSMAILIALLMSEIDCMKKRLDKLDGGN